VSYQRNVEGEKMAKKNKKLDIGKTLMAILRKLDEMDRRILAKSCSNCGNFDIETGGCMNCVSKEGTFTEVAPDYYCENWKL